MIETLAGLRERAPGHPIGRVEVECKGCQQRQTLKWVRDYGSPCIRYSECGAFPDLSTILVCTEAGEAGRMCGISEWNVCGECSWDGGSEKLVVITGGIAECPSCGAPCVDMIEPTHRLFLWDGKPVEYGWEELWPHPAHDEVDPHPLTAVVLVGEPGTDHLGIAKAFDIKVDAARAACASAGVQFVSEGRLEL